MTDQGLTAAIKTGDRLLKELDALSSVPPPASSAPTMGRLQKVHYSHDAMIDLVIQNPWISQNEIAAHFGYTPAWISNVFASDAFQARMAERREEVIDPALKATIEERFRALVIKSLEVLQAKLNAPQVSDQVAIRAAELGAKALGVGGHAPPAPAQPSQDRLVVLHERLVYLNRKSKGEVYEAELPGPQGAEAGAGEGLRVLQGPESSRDVAREGAGAAQADRGGAGQDAA